MSNWDDRYVWLRDIPLGTVWTEYHWREASQIYQEATALRSRLAEAEADLTEQRRLRDYFGNQAAQIYERLSAAEALLRDTKEWFTSEAEYDETDVAAFVSCIDAFLAEKPR